MEARMIVEPECARLAAMNATGDQIESMRQVAKRIRASQNWTAYKQGDRQLHELIAQASGNKLLSVLQRIVEEVRASVVWDKLDTSSPAPPSDYWSFAEHDRIIKAIAGRDRDAASEAMRCHLRTTYDRLLA
ncbi:FCD domain-containing protein [Bradyrhizobium sp. 14AA]